MAADQGGKGNPTKVGSIECGKPWTQSICLWKSGKASGRLISERNTAKASTQMMPQCVQTVFGGTSRTNLSSKNAVKNRTAGCHVVTKDHVSLYRKIRERLRPPTNAVTT